MVSAQVLRIALDVPLNRLFDYLNNGFKAQLGARVIVPFSGRRLIGVIVDITDDSDVPQSKLKLVHHVFDDVVLDDKTFKLLKFCADYHHYPLGQILISTLPLRLRQLKPAVTRKTFIYTLNGAVALPAISKRQVVLQRVAAALKNNEALSEYQLSALSGSWRKAIKQLETWGCLHKKEVIKMRPSLASSSIAPALNDEQVLAIQAVLFAVNTFKPWLLFGVTGSGKTEVYMQLLQKILAEKNAQALVLVPEINLTPQLESRFRSRLSNYPLVTLHSNLGESERLQNWQAASTGEAKIVIGTRLSVFVPMPHLKIILIDEEHDASYKQQDGMRYHARDVAIVRAKQLNIPIVMGSATPSLEVWHKAQKKHYDLLRLSSRAVVNARLPNIHCIDVAKSPVKNGLSPLLIKAIQQRLNRGEQSLIFLNRRGYAPVIYCSACQWAAPCMRCSAKLVVHLNQKRLKCHHCGHEQSIPIQCPSCGSSDLSPIGQATQRLQQTLADLFPDAKIARVDRDSVRNKNALTTLLTQVQNKEVDILVGTQMLAKGHDFPYLTLVGVVDTDTALFSPDFRASERLFSQLMQVSGRAGRAEKSGEVLIQTIFPQHDLFDAIRQQDYETYANKLIDERATMQFPPSCYFAVLKAEANYYALVQQFLTIATILARPLPQGMILYDPVRPQMERLKGMERGQLLMQADSRQILHRFLRQWMPQLRDQKEGSKIRWALDIDPIEI